MLKVWIVSMNVSLCQWKQRRNNIKSDFPSSTLSITSSYMLFFLPISTTCIPVSTMSSQSWSSLTDLKTSPRGLNTWWFIHVQTHNLLKHTQSVSPLEDLKDVALHWFSLACSYVSLWRIQPRRPISQLDQIMKPGITERMLRLWFSTPPFCVYSCVTLQAANYGLILIIMDFVFLQQPLTARTFYEPLGIWPIRQEG